MVNNNESPLTVGRAKNPEGKTPYKDRKLSTSAHTVRTHFNSPMVNFYIAKGRKIS